MDHSSMMASGTSLWEMAIIHFITMIVAMVVYDLVKSFFKKGGH
jgi:hypothetical protein